jgi:hypothetical protein
MSLSRNSFKHETPGIFEKEIAFIIAKMEGGADNA